MEAARILRVTKARLRSFERMDLVRPAQGADASASFDFRDRLSLRALVGLLDRGVSVRRIRRRCSEGCKGLCPRCGADLNKETCACPAEKAASPFAELAKLKK